ncbi:MAG: hypothetical protein ABFD69_00725 [Candidatus Sumerlaeia bacterium]
MCHYITELLPETVDPSIYNECFKPLGRQLTPIDNPSIMAQVGRGYCYYCGTACRCDCGTTIGSLNVKMQRKIALNDEIKKLRRKKWSEHKIGAWLTEKAKANEKLEREQPATTSKEAEQWVECIARFLDRSKGGRIGLLLHLYDRSLESRITLKGFQEIRLGDLTPEKLMRIAEDRVYWITS